MILPRREFLKLLGVTAGASALGGCSRDWLVPDRLVELALRGPGIESWKQTICGLCESGCGASVRLVDGLPVGLKGNPRHPLNRGGLCPVGQAGLEVLYAPERLREPLRRQPDGSLATVTWDDALAEIGARLRALRDAGEGHRMAVLSDEPGRLLGDLTERFARAVGSANVSGTRPTVTLPFRLTQGIDQVPGFDLAGADLVLAFGLDLYEDGPAPMHAIAAMVGTRQEDARGALIHVGPRLSPSCARAEEHVPVEPGTYGALALGIAHVLVREGHIDRRFIAEHTSGFEDWTDAAGRRRQGFRHFLLENFYPDRAAQLCGCEPARIVRLARRFARAAAPVAVAGSEATAGSNATATAVAVHALNALVGAFDRPGGVMLPPAIPLAPLPPLPKGVPEIPAVATGAATTAAGSPPPPLFAPPAGSDLLDVDPLAALVERLSAEPDAISALFIINANPVHESPLGDRLRELLERVPLVVALGSFPDDTTPVADYVLPIPAYLESWQESSTPPGTAISVLGLGQPVIEPLHDVRHPGDILLELAHRTGGATAETLPWPRYPDYLKQRLEGLEVAGQGSVFSGSFEESWVHFLEERGWRFLEHADVDAFWDDLISESGWWNPVHSHGDWERLFRTPSGRYEFCSQMLEQHLRAAGHESVSNEDCLPHYEPPVAAGGAGELWCVPFRPLTARGRLGVRSPMVLEMFSYPFLSGWQTWAEMAPDTAQHLRLGDGDIVSIESERGAIEAVLRVAPGTVPGVVAVAAGLGHSKNTGGAAAGIGSNPHTLLADRRDPLSGALSLTSTRVRVRRVRRRPHGAPAPRHHGGNA